LLQVLSNLIGNAIKFTPSGGKITLTVEDAPASDYGGRYTPRLRFCVSDTGSGIDQEHLPLIFDRYWKAKSQPSALGRTSTGLGLAIAKAIVEAHGGRIWAESKLKVGSRFYFEIPRLQKDSVASPQGLTRSALSQADTLQTS
jgi:signal transduction histidine kinase